MIPQTAGKILEELQEKGLVEEKDGSFSLTEKTR
jgi:Mn-dependent DtxR family transcriptional regulator